MLSVCIDTGNSCTKIGVFEQDNLLEKHVFELFGLDEIKLIFEKYAISACIFSSVAKHNEAITDELRKRSPYFIEFSHETAIPVVNKYATPQTLGKDRLAGVIGANYLMPGKNILVIDAGSAITYDFITADDFYLGGNISPGIDLRFRALHKFTGRLPLVEAKIDNPLLGNDTQSAILAGVMQGIIFEIAGYIKEFKKLYPNLSVFLTGGSAFFFANRLKSPIFANENLILIGLNRILQYNAKK